MWTPSDASVMYAVGIGVLLYATYYFINSAPSALQYAGMQ